MPESRCEMENNRFDYYLNGEKKRARSLIERAIACLLADCMQGLLQAQASGLCQIIGDQVFKLPAIGFYAGLVDFTRAEDCA